MKGILGGIAVLLTFARQSLANLDVISLYASDSATIIEASATLILPNIPSAITGDMALWSAIQLDQDFIQGVTENAPSGLGYCQNLGENWCNFAYALTPDAENGTPVIVAPGSEVRTHYKLNSVTQNWDQDLYVNGQLASSVSTSQGQKGNIFYVSMECVAGTCAKVPQHTWKDVSIVLSNANPGFGNAGNWNYGATGGVMSTPDGGKTWNFTTLNVPSTSF